MSTVFGGRTDITTNREVGVRESVKCGDEVLLIKCGREKSLTGGRRVRMRGGFWKGKYSVSFILVRFFLKVHEGTQKEWKRTSMSARGSKVHQRVKSKGDPQIRFEKEDF